MRIYVGSASSGTESMRIYVGSASSGTEFMRIYGASASFVTEFVHIYMDSSLQGLLGPGSGGDPKNSIFEACSKPSHFLYLFSIRFAISGSGAWGGSFAPPEGT